VNDRLNQIALHTQDQLLVPLGLRVPFRKAPIWWSDQASSRVARGLKDDIRTYLEAFGKPIEIWPRFAELIDG
jgi:hypothetical protein